MGGLFGGGKKSSTAKYIERPGAALMKDMPQYTAAARQATAERLRNIAMVVPGAEAARRGEIPEDVRQQTMRSIAEFGGAGFDPTTAGMVGGFQAAQALVPRQFGLLSTQMVDTGLRWSQLADAYDPFKAAQFAGPSQRFGEARAEATRQDVASYNQAVSAQQRAAVGGLTGLASIALAPAIAPALFGGLASGAAGLGLGAAGTAAQLGTGAAGTLFNIGAGRVGSGLAAGAAVPVVGIGSGYALK